MRESRLSAFAWVGTAMICGVWGCGGSGLIADSGTAPPSGSAGSTGSGAASDAAPGGAAAASGGAAMASGGAAGGVPFTPVDPQISRHWRWQPCGSIPPTAGGAVQAVFPPAGSALAVLYEDGRVLLHPTDGSAGPTILRPAGAPPASIAFSLDGAWLAEAAAGVVRVRDVATGTMVRTMKADTACTGSSVRFSAEGDHVLAWDQTSLCVWQTADGALVTRLAGSFGSAGMRGGRILTVDLGESPDALQGVVKSWPLSGADPSEIALEMAPGGTVWTATQLWVSPRGDTFAALGRDSSAAYVYWLWSMDGTLLGSFPGGGAFPVYSASGSSVLFGNDVVDVTTLARSTNTEVEDEYPPTAIDETGTWIASIEGLVAAVVESGVPASRRVFGALPVSAPSSPELPTIVSLSPDGSRLVAATTTTSLLWRLGSDFAASAPIRWLQQSVPLEASFSATSGEVLSSGDGAAVFSTDDGTLLDALLLPPEVPTSCAFTVGHLSSDGQRLAIGGLTSTVDIVARHGLKTLASLPTGGCQERGSFNGDGSLLALPGPELYRTADWSLLWPTRIVPEPPSQNRALETDIFRDAQFAPGEKAILISGCTGPLAGTDCAHALYSAQNGTLVQGLPQLSGTRARFSPEGNWIVSAGTALHLPTGESLVFDPTAVLATFAPNGDIVAILQDDTLARYCRAS
jgi:hypothetical protein